MRERVSQLEQERDRELEKRKALEAKADAAGPRLVATLQPVEHVADVRQAT